MDHGARLQVLSRALDRERIDFLLVSHLPNIRYLCGFSGSAAQLLVGSNGATLFTDGRYTAQAREEVNDARIVIQRKAPLVAATEWIASHKGAARRQILGIESEHMTVAERSRLAKFLPDGIRITSAPALVEQARMVKDAEEVTRIRRAALLGAGLFDTVLKTLRPGAREADVAAAMEFQARKSGAEGMSFDTIIASGKRSSLPHGRASIAPIPRSGFVVCDFGVILAGYCSDRTRTVYVGRPSREARRFYDAVHQAQQAALGSVRPGATVGEVDRAARKVLQKAGLGRYFSHSTGHGVGLEIHEAPRVAAGQSEILRPGMVITVEPGAYVPGRWGVRIEDMVVVTEHGAEVLAPSAKELISI
jgi:Xaa-Pro aminopeptidase